MSLIPPDKAHPGRRPASALRWALRLLLWPMALVGGLLLIAWLALQWAILPHIQQWRPLIQARVGDAIGVPVNIGRIEVRSGGWVPAIELHDVVLLDPQKRPALSLPRVAFAFSPGSLLAFAPRFEQLLVEGAHLEVRRDGAGRIFVAGLEVSGQGGADNAVADWLVKQHEIVVRGGSLRWTDEGSNAPALALGDVQFVMRNGLRNHALRLDATPAPEWGDRFTLRGLMTGSLLARAGDWRRWSGTVYAELPRADVRQLRRHVSLPFELTEGIGALRGWLEVQEGEPRGATVDLALRAVSARLAANVAPLTLAQLEGRLGLERTDLGLAVAVQRLGFLAGDGLRWRSGDMRLALRQRPGEPSTGGDFSAQRLDLGLLASVAASLPLGDAMRRLLGQVKPQGELGDVTVQWDGPLDAPAHYRIKAGLSGLALAARAADQPDAVGRPGLRNASVQLDANQDGGTARLTLLGGAIELPGVFEEALLPLDRLSAQLAWKIEANKVTVEIKDARFANRDAQGRFDAVWSTTATPGPARGWRLPGQIGVDGRLTQAVAARTARYLPLGISEATRRYVARAVRDGALSDVDFHVKGDLADFPFHGPATQGEFRIKARADDVTFAYLPGAPATPAQAGEASPWPALTRASAELVLDRTSLQILKGSAQLEGLAWSGVQGGIQNLVEEPVLALDGHASGPLTEMLRLVNATPIGGWIDKSLARSTASGAAELQLGLAIPLRNVDASQVQGKLVLPGNDLRITPDTPLLAGARGQVDFDRKGFAVVGATARTYGGEMGFEGGTHADAGIRFTGRGSTTAEALRGAPELGPVSGVAVALKGQTSYAMELAFVRGHAELLVTSNLVGLASELPAPLGKAASTPLALRYQTRLERNSLGADQPLRDSLRLDLGTLVQAQYQRDLSGPSPRVLRGGVAVQGPVATPASGVALDINLASLDVDAWLAARDKMFPPGAGGAAPGGADESDGYVPSVLTVRAQDMVFLARRLSKVLANVTLDKGLWRANLDADQLKGYVEYRAPEARATRAASAAGHVYARLSRLSLPKGEVDAVESLLDQPPSSTPSLDIVVNDFELRGNHLGRLEIEAFNRVYVEGQDALREWHLAKFNLLAPEAQLTASGQWVLGGSGGAGGRRAEMDFKLALADSGRYLERLGLGRTVRGGKGQITGQLAWQGSPLTVDYASLTGQAHVEIEAGQFLKADAGAARLLGVLSLQSLPRRLALDFRDLFQEGFSFDSFAGDLKIQKGIAQTNNLRMRGVQAAVLMEGRADLARETQDLRVVVVPEINAGTASLAYAIINPAVGLGTFLAQMFLRQPFIRAGTREFHVTGSWADPKVDRVERNADAIVPDVDAPAPDTPATR